MAKSSGSKSRRKRSDGHDLWSYADHTERLSSSKNTKKSRLTAILTHNTIEKRNTTRLNLLITKTQRSVNDLRKRLVAWDAISEKQLFFDKQFAEEEKFRKDTTGDIPKKKKGRLGPETWKLKGAARPAWDVYDFDVRYKDPYIKAHEEAAAKAKRCVNLLLTYKGRCGELMKQVASNFDDIESIDDHHITLINIREYLSMLMDLGFLSYEAKKHKIARSVWLECIELEGRTAVTSARESLFKMCIELQKYESVLNLYSEYQSTIFESDNSCWLRYSVAMASFHVNGDDSDNGKQRHSQKEIPDITSMNHGERKKTVNSNGSSCRSEMSTSDLVVQAIKSNIFCAYFISFHETIFSSVMEYTADIDDMQNDKDEDEPESTFEEALDYCYSGDKMHLKLWLESGASRTIRDALFSNEAITADDIEWDSRLTQIVKHYRARRQRDTLRNVNVDHEHCDGNETSTKTSTKQAKEHEIEASIKEATPQSIIEHKSMTICETAADRTTVSIDIPMFAEMFRTGMEMMIENKLMPRLKY